jgi:putative nucleotidyltransferase with HDIG domain
VPQEIIDPKVRMRINTDVKTEFDKLNNHLEIDMAGIFNVTQTLIGELTKSNIVCDVMDLKMNDDYTYQHCIGVAILAAIVCRKMEMREEQTQKIVMGALMHDIGKIIIPKNILNKPEKLTKEEYEIIKGHAEIGYKIVEKDSCLSPVTKLTILCHHEREDGSGYPLGKGEELHIGAKVVGACDVFHALLSNRPYRQALSVKEVSEIAQNERINVPIRETIQSVLAFYPIGTIVLLSNGDIGIVEMNFSHDVKRPLVQVVCNIKTNNKQHYKVNLQDEMDIYIVQKMPDIPVQ